MSSYKADAQYINFLVCQMAAKVSTRSDRLIGIADYYTPTSCCGKLKAILHKCAIMFSSKVDSTYKFDTSTYEGDNKWSHYA